MINKQNALPNKSYTLNANPEYNWSLSSFNWMIFEGLPEFILLEIFYKIFLTLYHFIPSIFTTWHVFILPEIHEIFSSLTRYNFTPAIFTTWQVFLPQLQSYWLHFLPSPCSHCTSSLMISLIPVIRN